MYVVPETKSGNEIDIWEMYSMHTNLPHKIRYLGKWKEVEGIEFHETRKWLRRSDLEVRCKVLTSRVAQLQLLSFIAHAQGAKLNIQSMPDIDVYMTQINDKDEYEFEPSEIPNIWNVLQVKHLYCKA